MKRPILNNEEALRFIKNCKSSGGKNMSLRYSVSTTTISKWKRIYIKQIYGSVKKYRKLGHR